MALYVTVKHRAQRPDATRERLAIDRNSPMRIYNPKNPPMASDISETISVSAKDLPPELSELIGKAFRCYERLLDGRHEQDEVKIWQARSEEKSIKRRIGQELSKGNIPRDVPILLEVAQRMVSGTEPQQWQEVLENYCAELKASPSPRPGA